MKSHLYRHTVSVSVGAVSGAMLAEPVYLALGLLGLGGGRLQVQLEIYNTTFFWK